VALIAFSMVTSSRRAEVIYAQLDQLNVHHQRADNLLRRLRSDVNLSGIFVRDYLLDVERNRAPEYREELTEFRRANMATLDDLEALIGRDDRISGLRTRLDDYWATFDPLFEWTPFEKVAQSAKFLRLEVVPRRDAVLTIAQEIEQLNNANLEAQRAAVDLRYAAFHDDLQRLLWQTVLIGVVVALVVVVRLRILERRSEEAERQMRELSQQLVNTQEEERRTATSSRPRRPGPSVSGWAWAASALEQRRRVSAVSPSASAVDDMFRLIRDPRGATACSTTSACRRSAGTSTRLRAATINADSRWTATSTPCPTNTAPASTASSRRR
jgi:hypothetical protein